MYPDSWYYPVGVTSAHEHFNPVILTHCDECGGDIERNEIYVRYEDCDYCRECATEYIPDIGDVCEHCGRKYTAKDTFRMFDVNGKKVCMEHIELRKAGEEW